MDLFEPKPVRRVSLQIAQFQPGGYTLDTPTSNVIQRTIRELQLSDRLNSPTINPKDRGTGFQSERLKSCLDGRGSR